jgi:hypothetical protein
MKLPQFFPFVSRLDTENTTKQLGIEWYNCRQGPLTTIKKPDQDYYDYIIINFHLIWCGFSIEVFYKKMPYTNLEQYKLFLKIQRSLK